MRLVGGASKGRCVPPHSLEFSKRKRVFQVNNHISAVEVFHKAQADLEQWERKRRSAETLLKEATARTQELNQFLRGLRVYLPESATAKVGTEVTTVTGEFSGMSTREAIKIVLQKENRALSSADIATFLTEGGVKSESASFRSNVSAILSVMQSRHHEVLKTPQGWILSQPSLVSAESSDEAAA